MIPLPLEQQNTSDGGQMLIVKGAMPPFGTQRPTKATDTYVYQVDVIASSPNVVGRLYIQLNGSCCDLNLDDSNITRYLQQNSELRPIEPLSSRRYTMFFGQNVLPCAQGFPGSTAFVIPVITSEGFSDGPGGVFPDALGEVDRTHYWTVNCPR